MKQFFFSLIFFPLLALAQKGIRFEHGLSWAQIQSKAKAENKYIFMDAFTTWCGPCIQMAKNVFPLEEVGEFFNDKYINVKVQLDSTENDNAEVRSWYQDGHDIMRKYKVNVFPTYLFFDPSGKIVHRAVGSSDADKFIAKATDALNPDRQYYALLDRYNGGEKNPLFLRKLAVAAQDAYDNVVTKKLYKEYLLTQTDYSTPENLVFLNRFTKTSRDTGFIVIMNNPEKYDALRGKGASNKRIVEIIMQEEVMPKVYRKNPVTPDFDGISNKVTQKYPMHGAEAVANVKVTYYQNRQDWQNFQIAIVDYMKAYGENLSAEQLNSFAKTVFENCDDIACMKEALEWSKRSLAKKKIPAYVSTYASLLYKLGEKNEAIKWQEEAVAATGRFNKPIYTDILEKMKRGEKTWNK